MIPELTVEKVVAPEIGTQPILEKVATPEIEVKPAAEEVVPVVSEIQPVAEEVAAVVSEVQAVAKEVVTPEAEAQSTVEEAVAPEAGAQPTTPKKVRIEVFAMKGDEVVARLKEIIHQGNVRRIVIKNEEGKSLIEVPLTIGVIGALLLPVWAAIGAIAALIADCTILVEREEEVVEPTKTDAAPQ